MQHAASHTQLTFDFSAVYIVCLFISYASPLILFSALFLTYLVLVFYCVVVHFFWLVNGCFYCVRFSFFPYQAKRLAWGNVSEMTYFVSSGT